MSNSTHYIPALSFKWLTPLYDPLFKWVFSEETFKGELIQQANIQAGMNILDLGCGTGTLTLMLKRAHPDTNIIGLDGDTQILEIAHKKSRNEEIRWERGLATSLPYPDSTFDRVITSLVIHHLTTNEKRLAFREMYRVLKPQGELHILDFGTPHGTIGGLWAKIMRHLEEAADNFDGLIPQFILESGFQSVNEREHFVTLFGPLSLWQAIKG
jgi:ubiquinone/menaquinone biosynthesis C-methylase UbiE